MLFYFVYNRLLKEDINKKVFLCKIAKKFQFTGSVVNASAYCVGDAGFGSMAYDNDYAVRGPRQKNFLTSECN